MFRQSLSGLVASSFVTKVYCLDISKKKKERMNVSKISELRNGPCLVFAQTRNVFNVSDLTDCVCK